jgi:hypothetical protein
MTNNPFQKAVKSQAKLRLALDGPAGSGKTWTALEAATVMAEGGKIAFIDTERNSAALYADRFDFDVVCLPNAELKMLDFRPAHFVALIHMAEDAGYAVIVIDSLSHAWEGKGGARDMQAAAVDRQKTKNEWTAWRDVTPAHNELVDALLGSSAHIIITMRSKMEYAQEDGKVKKIGLAPIQRPGMEYEFSMVCDIDIAHTLVVSKSRCDEVSDAVERKPGAQFFGRILDWLKSGAPAKPEAPKTEVAPGTAPKLTWRAALDAVCKLWESEKNHRNHIENSLAKSSLQNLTADEWCDWLQFYWLLRSKNEDGNVAMAAADKLLASTTETLTLAQAKGWRRDVRGAFFGNLDTGALDAIYTNSGLSRLTRAAAELVLKAQMEAAEVVE